MSRTAVAVGLLVGVVAALLAGCGDEDEEGSITVLAAASLTDAFTELGSVFEDRHPGTAVELSFGPSSGLASQVIEGADADVFASANQTQMDVVLDAGDADGGSQPFARNRLEIAVPPGNPGDVSGLDDFARDGLLIGLCAEQVPCGQFGREALSSAGVTPSVDTNETDVRALLTKIEAGELDAGIVYETDVLAAGEGVEGIEIPDDQNAVATYAIVALSASSEPEAAAAFVEFVLSSDGLDVLQRDGFQAP